MEDLLLVELELLNALHYVIQSSEIISMNYQYELTILFRAVETDPHGSTIIFPPGSGFRRENF